MKTITELISEKPLGTVFNTEESLPDAQDFTKIMLGTTFRCVGYTQVIECEDGSIMTLKNYLPGYEENNNSQDEDEEDDQEEDEDYW